MKKVFYICTLLATGIAFAQETTDEAPNTTTEPIKEAPVKAVPQPEPRKKQTLLGFNYNYTEPLHYGFSVEASTNSNYKNFFVNINYADLDYDALVEGLTAEGFAVEVGNRIFKDKSLEGFYTENAITYGKVKFDETYYRMPRLKGEYSYWSIINPSIGYRFRALDLAFDAFAGFMWKWEVKGKGDVDNKDFDNFVFKAGFRVSFVFNRK